MSTEQDPTMAQPTALATDTAPLTTADLTTKLSQLQASATQHYALKNYSAAAEAYSEAAEIQDQINGEMSPDNADLLYQYGRCLYHVAVSQSDVLGGKVAGTEEPKRKKRKVDKGKANGSGEGSSGGVIGDALKGAEVKETAGEEEEMKKEQDSTASKPYFQITGDENWTDSEDDEEDNEAAADAQAEEEEDDFATAFEILDVARVLLSRKLAQTSHSSSPDQHRQLQERLADTHDLQAEISLENERFQDAINDTRDSLALKVQLYPQESSLIAEAHFKLSLALEFASVTSTSTSGEQVQGEGVDETLRAEAAAEMEKAIASCNLRVATETTLLATLPADQMSRQKESIEEVKQMVTEMQDRLIDLRNPAVSDDGIKGALGAMLGGPSGGEQKKRVQEVTEGARDLSGLVKKKKPKLEASEETVGNGAVAEVVGKGKRKAEDAADVSGVGAEGKKVKFEDGN